MKIYDPSTGQVTASSAWSDAQLGHDVPTTQLVRNDVAQSKTMPGEAFFRRIKVPSMSFEYRVNGAEHMQLVDTERGPRADIGTVDFKVRKETQTLKRFSVATKRDQDEIALSRTAQPTYPMRRMAVNLARKVVELDLESRRAALVVDPASYPTSNVVTLAPGSEFNGVNGDSRTVVRALMDILTEGTPIQDSDLKAFGPRLSIDAAREDTTWLQTRGNFTDKFPSLSEIRDYWDIGEVTTGNVHAIDASGVSRSLYPDFLMIWYPGDGIDVDTEQGDLEFGIRGGRTGGFALKPYFVNGNTCWYFGYQDYENPAITRGASGIVVFNTNANVTL